MFLAKIAADFDKPNGLSLLLPEDMPGRLLDLDLTDLTGVAKAMETRLHQAGIRITADLWALSPREFHRIWGGIEGERYWYKLHGYDLPGFGTKRSTIGHSRVLEPKLREPVLAHYVAKRLLLKAVARMRRTRYCAGALFAWKARKCPNADLSRAIDAVHQRFGRKVLTIGYEPADLADLGTKIAFTRVPDADEFAE